MNERITRQQLIAAAVDRHLRARLFQGLGYQAADVEVMEAFPHDVFDGPLDKNYIAAGFDEDDGGAAGEMGSDLIVRVHNIELFVFAKSPGWGRNLGPTVRDIFDVGNIPIYDIRQAGAPEIDRLVILQSSGDHQPVADPKPWEENVWVVTLQAEDAYYSSSW